MKKRVFPRIQVSLTSHTAVILLLGMFILVLSVGSSFADVTSVGPITYINLITGRRAEDINNTLVTHGVGGTDLGITIYNPANKRLHYFFGDTTGNGIWWSPSMSFSRIITDVTNPDDPTRQRAFEGYFNDWHDAGGNATQLWNWYVKKGWGDCYLDHPADGYEVSQIPTTAWIANGNMYLWYESVHCWNWNNEASYWETNGSWIAYSSDNGVNWSKGPQVSPGDGRRSQAAAVNATDGYTYFFLTYPGRIGKDRSAPHPVYLARTPKSTVLDKTTWQFWNSPGAWVTLSAWSNPLAVLEGQIGELSVIRNTALNCYLAMYKEFMSNRLRLAQAPTPTGPWSGFDLDIQSVTGNPYNPIGVNGFTGEYGGFITKDFVDIAPDSSWVDLYFTLSESQPRYNVHLLKVRLYN
jgi:hypothetical protein